MSFGQHTTSDEKGFHGVSLPKAQAVESEKGGVLGTPPDTLRKEK